MNKRQQSLIEKKDISISKQEDFLKLWKIKFLLWKRQPIQGLSDQMSHSQGIVIWSSLQLQINTKRR